MFADQTTLARLLVALTVASVTPATDLKRLFYIIGTCSAVHAINHKVRLPLVITITDFLAKFLPFGGIVLNQ